MDGYVRFNTDEKGKVIDIWDTWYKDEKTEDYVSGVGIDHFLNEDTHKPDSLILLVFKIEVLTIDSYFSGREYEDEFIVENEIVLIEDYNHQDMEEEVDSDIFDFFGIKTGELSNLNK